MPLIRDYVAEQLLDVSDPADQLRLRVGFEQLTEHISKEEDGLFPASVVTRVVPSGTPRWRPGPRHIRAKP
jgi:hypothetical protein